MNRIASDSTPPGSGGVPRCRACVAVLPAEPLWVRERQLSIGGDFEYRACQACGSLSIVTVPADLERFYGRRYYSFNAIETPPRPSGWRRWEEIIREELATDFRLVRSARRTWRRLGLGRDARILDVGCGNGKWLAGLHAQGYRRLSGIDSFLDPELETDTPFSVRRGRIEDVAEGWDLIAYHHVLEHVPDPRRELTAAVARLHPGGALLVRVPVADSWARKRFGTSWLQWDAPRHLWLPTRKALRLLAQEHGLRIAYQADDSVAFPLWASRGYELGLSGFDHALNPTYGPLKDYVWRLPRVTWMWCWSAWLNLWGRGDQLTLILRKPC